ncbi:MAG: FliO/MopB family protein [Bacillota bacterium]
MNFGWEIAKIVFYLLVVIGIIYLVTYFLKKRVFRNQTGRYLRTIDQLYFDSKTALLLVTIKDRVLLLGRTEEQLTRLAEWSREEFKEISNNDQGSGSGDEEFDGYIEKFLRVSRRDQDE